MIRKQSPLSVLVFIDSLVVSALQDAGGYAIYRQNNLELHLSCHTCWLSYFTLVCLWGGGTVARLAAWLVARSLGRSVYGHVITKFLEWVDLLGYGAPHARASRGVPLLIRKQRVRYEVSISRTPPIEHGVPKVQSWVQLYSGSIWMILLMKLVIVKPKCMLIIANCFSSLRYQIQLMASQLWLLVASSPQLTNQFPGIVHGKTISPVAAKDLGVHLDQCLNYTIDIANTVSATIVFSSWHRLIKLSTSWTESHSFYL